MTFIRTNAKFEWSAGFMPADKQYGAPTGDGSFYIFNKILPDHVAAAWTLIRWMTEPIQAARWSVGTGYVPIHKTIRCNGTLPGRWRSPSRPAGGQACGRPATPTARSTP